MKNFKILATLLLCSVLSFYNCKENTKEAKDDIVKPVQVEESISPTKATTPALKEPAQNAAGVWHYTCRIGCPGGSGAADKCATCGNVLVHNTIYHGNATNTANTTNTNASPMVNPAATPPKVEPAQNAAGVWHYTCSKGCAGGSGAAGKCATCSGALAHNSAYH